MSFFISKFFWAFAGPNAVLLTLLLAGLILGHSRWKNAGQKMITAGVLGLLAVTFLPLDDWLLSPLENRFPSNHAFPARVDGIIVLGGAINPIISGERGIPSLNDAAERLTSFVSLAKQYPSARVVFTGGSLVTHTDGTSEAKATQQLLTSLGLDGDRVIFEDQSRNTYENATMSKALAHPTPDQTWVLVTSASHMPRTVGVFRQAGWPVVPWPVAFKSSHDYTVNLAEHLRHLEWAVHEWIGLVVYRLSGRSDALFPGPL